MTDPIPAATQCILNTTGYETLLPSVVSARDFLVTDKDGRQYVDFESGVWCTVLGHGHPAVTRALTEQLGVVGHVGYRYSHDVVLDAARLLLARLEMGGGQCLFLSSGSEAVDLAVRMARELTGRQRLLCLDGYYLSAFGVTAMPRGADVAGLSWTDFVMDDGAVDVEAALAGIAFEEIGAFVLEPGNCSGRVLLPPRDLVAAIAERVRAHGGLVVVDEVTTGFGRTGRWFGFQHFDLAPDIVACGKAMGNGYPVSAVAVTGAVARRIDKHGLRYAQSHQNDPAAAAVVKAVIETMDAVDLVERSRPVTDRLLGGLRVLADEHESVREVRGVGLMLALELHPSPLMTAVEVQSALLDRGFLVGSAAAHHTLRFYPPLTIDGPSVDSLLAALDEVLTFASGAARAKGRGPTMPARNTTTQWETRMSGS